MKKFMNADFEVIVNVSKSTTTLPAIEAIKTETVDIVADTYVINSVRHKIARFGFPLWVLLKK